jgi:hypothetical protein
MKIDDDTLLKFLCESVHPMTGKLPETTKEMVEKYNSFLGHDGYRIVPNGKMSGKLVYVAKLIGISATPALNAVKEVLNGTDTEYLTQQIARMEGSVNDDPDLAIGTSKELIETFCKTILHENNIDYTDKDDLQKLVKMTMKELTLTPEDIPDQVKASQTIKRLLNNLANITQGIAELRNKYGTGHGKHKNNKGLQPRHAKLAVGAASTLVGFLSETNIERMKERSNDNFPDYICSTTRQLKPLLNELRKKKNILEKEKKSALEQHFSGPLRETELLIVKTENDISRIEIKIRCIENGYDHWDKAKFLSTSEAGCLIDNWYDIEEIKKLPIRIPANVVKSLIEARKSELFKSFQVCSIYEVPDDDYGNETLISVIYYLFGVQDISNIKPDDNLDLYLINSWEEDRG